MILTQWRTMSQREAATVSSEIVLTDVSFTIAPVADDETEPFWRFAGRREFRLQTCTACRSTRWPPGPVCRACHSPGGYWQEVVRGATLESWVVFRRQYFAEFPVPYTVGLGRLDAGPRFTAYLLSPPGYLPSEGDRLEIAFMDLSAPLLDIPDPQLPVYTPVLPGKSSEEGERP